jgi:hypothetical protein
MEEKDGARLTVDLCFRASVTWVTEARQEAVLDRVEQLARQGAIDDLSVHYWSSRVTAPDDGVRNDSGCPDLIQELYDVTEGTDCSLSPCFRETEGDRERRTVLFLPIVCLIVRRDGDVIGVYPSDRGDAHHSVTDGLGVIERGDDPATVPTPGEANPSL